ncbi:MAG TPA: DUF6600 domain-containing protein [Patescibacteria group bacterium]|nr:DUF6600 domain-containing protein [Patescibacteria group bacterium]
MRIWATRLTAILLALSMLLSAAPAARAAATAPPPPPGTESTGESIGRTPPRLSYMNGEVSFWRPGAVDWGPAQVNTPLAPGDELYTGANGNIELQVGGRAFVRAWTDTQMGLVNQEPDFVQLKVTSGHLSLDLRSVDPGRTVEVDTPQAAFTIDAPGYYRVDVTGDRTSFITRRSGRATMTPAGGQAVAIAPSEEVVLDAGATPRVQSFVAPQLDEWDNWNYVRTDQLLDSVSARYAGSTIYGVDDLDHYGNWRVVSNYGSVWVPDAVPAGWAPYSTGRWVADPYYGWTWVDTAPWGWAPYHHGRWVYVDSYWAWAPGPIVVRPVYSPALVVFFGRPGVQVAVGNPFVSWVALGWGEPIIPWWGSPRYIGRAHWAGWGGPRVVNNVVINRTTVVNVTNINVYRNVHVHNAVVAVREDNFGRRGVHDARVRDVDVRRLEPVRGRLHVKPDRENFVVSDGPAKKPPAHTVDRPVVGTRRPARPEPRDGAPKTTPAVATPAPTIVPKPTPAATTNPVRPPFGSSEIERPRPPQPPRFEGTRRDPDGQRPGNPRRDSSPAAPATPGAPTAAVPAPPREHPDRRGPQPGPQATPPTSQQTQPAPVPAQPAPRGTQPAPRVTQPAPQPTQPAPAAPSPANPGATRPAPRPLPGEPANRVFPGRQEPGGQKPAAFNNGRRPQESRAAAHPDARRADPRKPAEQKQRSTH